MAGTLPPRPIYQKGRATKSKPLRDDARGRPCTLQIPGVCTHDDSRTVGCHLRRFGFGGMGVKPSDLLIVDACDRCHAVLDSRGQWERHGLTDTDVLRALMTTLTNRHAAGLIAIRGE